MERKNGFGNIKGNEFDFLKIEKYFQYIINKSNYQYISDNTCKDLDFEDLFRYIDRTNSNIGQQYLYSKLRVINLQINNTEEAIIEKIYNSEDLQNYISKQLKGYRGSESYNLIDILNENTQPPSNLWIYKSIPVIVAILIFLSFFNNVIIFILAPIFIFNIVIHYKNKPNISYYSSIFSLLLKVTNSAKKLYKRDILRSINNKVINSIREIDKEERKLSLFNVDNLLQNDLAVVVWFIFEIVKITFLIEPLLFYSTIKGIKSKRKDIEIIYNYIGEIDSIYSIASLRKSCNKWCKPKFISNREVIIKEIYHPLIENCISNDFILNEKSMIITGSNMSGKSSFLRSIGINFITASTINTCFASEFIIPKSKLLTSIRVEDDLLNSKSFYFAEVLRIKEIIDQVDTQEEYFNIILIDEILKGTNSAERIVISKSLLEYVSKYKNNIVFISTHDIDLINDLGENYSAYHFKEEVLNGELVFNYKLQEGNKYVKNAISILEICNFPKEIIERARSPK